MIRQSDLHLPASFLNPRDDTMTMVVWRVSLFLTVMAAAMPASVCTGGEAAEVDFQTEIQPILAEHCARCHGVDSATREGGLRLDLRDAAIAGGDSGDPAVVPGDAEASLLIERVTSDDESIIMPPPDEQNPLSAAQIELLERWIAQGAPYAAHWAFTPPQPIDAQQLSGAADNGHPVDLIVRSKLQQWGLSPAGRAPDPLLCRRLYLDLIGLPPSPQQLAEFDLQGFTATVERLLASPRFGEKWARHWMDVARYSDTNGYEKDLRREQWIWRDWVIDALNQDKPYDEFIIEQIAGDLLPNPTQEQIIATGFLRNSMINEEGAIVPEQFRMVEMFDRMDCLGKAILGLTTQCAQCHSHKYDPLTHEEYYGMFAFLNNAYEAQSPVYSGQQQRQLAEFDQNLAELNQRVRQANQDWQSQIDAWQKSVLQSRAEWRPVVMSELGSISGLNHPVQLVDQSILMLGHVSADVFFISAVEDYTGMTGIQLEVLTHRSLPFSGPARNTDGTWGVLELEVYAERPGAANTESTWDKIALVNATADWSEPEKKHQKGKQTSGPVALLIDGSDDTWWRADRGAGRRHQSAVAVVQFEQPLELPAGTRLKFALRTGRSGMLGCCRVSLTRSTNPVAPPVNHAAVLAMQTPAEQRTASQQAVIFAAWRTTLSEQQSLQAEYDSLWQRYPSALTSVLHLAEREGRRQRKTYLLDRGEWDRPQVEIKPHTPAALHPFVDTDAPARLDFARWLVSDQSTLAARVTVNRVWQAIFGEGLVETSEDFGTRAPVPEHLELLDMLALDLMRHGWSQKHLIRTIVTSETYQQDSRVTPDRLHRDPRNRLLSRGPRFRAEAEVVRDIVLSAAGLLHNELGGPSVIPPVPKNVLDYNYTYPSYWKPAEPPQRYRRSVYGFRKRSMPDPVMSAFDSPNADTACARRVRSNTPLAALTGLNETVFVEAAQALALRVLRESTDDVDARLDHVFLLCTARRPDGQERAEITRFLDQQRSRLQAGQISANEIVGADVDPPAGSDLHDVAAWTLLARIMLNLDETISKN